MLKKIAGPAMLALLTTACVHHHHYDQDANRPGLPHPGLYEQDENLLTVSGTSIVFAKPDKVRVTFSLLNKNTDVKEGKHRHNETLEKTITYLKGAGFEEGDYKADNMTITYSRDYENSRHFDNYTLTTRFELTIEELERGHIGDTITGIVNCGVNQIDGIDYETDDHTQYRIEAREKAVEAAQSKAKEFAALLGKKPVRIKKIIQLDNGGSSYSQAPQLMVNYMARGGGSGAGESNSDIVSIGEIPYNGYATLEFELEEI